VRFQQYLSLFPILYHISYLREIENTLKICVNITNMYKKVAVPLTGLRLNDKLIN